MDLSINNNQNSYNQNFTACRLIHKKQILACPDLSKKDKKALIEVMPRIRNLSGKGKPDIDVYLPENGLGISIRVGEMRSYPDPATDSLIHKISLDGKKSKRDHVFLAEKNIAGHLYARTKNLIDRYKRQV